MIPPWATSARRCPRGVSCARRDQRSSARARKVMSHSPPAGRGRIARGPLGVGEPGQRAVVEFQQLIQRRDRQGESFSQDRGGLRRATQGAAQDAVRRHLRGDPVGGGAGLRASQFGQRQIGATFMALFEIPGRLPVPDNQELGGVARDRHRPPRVTFGGAVRRVTARRCSASRRPPHRRRRRGRRGRSAAAPLARSPPCRRTMPGRRAGDGGADRSAHHSPARAGSRR